MNKWMLGNHRGFMTMGGHLIGVVLFGLAMGLVAIVLDKWLESRLVFWLVIAALFAPLFVVTHAVADFISRKVGW